MAANVSYTDSGFKKCSFLLSSVGGAIMGKVNPVKVLKSRYFAFILYPDNPYHMQYLHFLETSHDGFYILHDKNADNFYIPMAGYEGEQHNEKSHFHVVVRFRNPRSLSGFQKSIPAVKYYQPLQLDNVDEKTKKRLFNVYDISCIDIPVQEIYKPVVEHIEPVTDIFGYCQYLLHKDFKSVVQGKKEYQFYDVKPLFCDLHAFSDYFDQTKQSENELLDTVLQIASCADGDKNTFVQLIQMHTNPNVLKYVQKHAYFIDKYILSPNRQIATKELYIND